MREGAAPEVTSHQAAWNALEKPWQTCLSLAWAAYARNTIPVGAVVVGRDGEVVSSGRNGVYVDEAGEDMLHRGALAHAEVNALARLDPRRRYEDHSVYGSLEPCLMCIGAAIIATVATIEYAGVDPYGGAADLLSRTNSAIERLDFKVRGPLSGPFGVLAAALHYEFFLRHNPQGMVVSTYRHDESAIAETGEGLNERRVSELAANGVPLDRALAEFWDLLV